MKKREMTLPLMFAAVAFAYCILRLATVSSGWYLPVNESPNHFMMMIVFAFFAVLTTAYPYHLLRPDGLELKNYAQIKSLVFCCCAIPFLAILVYISRMYALDLWLPLAVRNVWNFAMAYVICCFGFVLFLMTTAHDIQSQRQ